MARSFRSSSALESAKRMHALVLGTVERRITCWDSRRTTEISSCRSRISSREVRWAKGAAIRRGSVGQPLSLFHHGADMIWPRCRNRIGILVLDERYCSGWSMPSPPVLDLGFLASIIAPGSCKKSPAIDVHGACATLSASHASRAGQRHFSRNAQGASCVAPPNCRARPLTSDHGHGSMRDCRWRCRWRFIGRSVSQPGFGVLLICPRDIAALIPSNASPYSTPSSRCVQFLSAAMRVYLW